MSDTEIVEHNGRRVEIAAAHTRMSIEHGGSCTTRSIRWVGRRPRGR